MAAPIDTDSTLRGCLELLARYGLRAVTVKRSRAPADPRSIPGGDRFYDDEFSLPAAARFLTLSVWVLRRAIKRGELAAETLNGPHGKHVFALTHEGLIQFCEKRQIRPEKVTHMRRYLARRARQRRARLGG